MYDNAKRSVSACFGNRKKIFDSMDGNESIKIDRSV